MVPMSYIKKRSSIEASKTVQYKQHKINNATGGGHKALTYPSLLLCLIYIAAFAERNTEQQLKPITSTNNNWIDDAALELDLGVNANSTGLIKPYRDLIAKGAYLNCLRINESKHLEDEQWIAFGVATFNTPKSNVSFSIPVETYYTENKWYTRYTYTRINNLTRDYGVSTVDFSKSHHEALAFTSKKPLAKTGTCNVATNKINTAATKSQYHPMRGSGLTRVFNSIFQPQGK